MTWWPPIIRTVFAQPDKQHIHKQFGEVNSMLACFHLKGRRDA
jgi:hypothetical protein